MSRGGCYAVYLVEFAQGAWWIHGPGRVAGVYPYDIGRMRPQPKSTPCALGHCRFKCVFLLYTWQPECQGFPERLEGAPKGDA